MHFQTKNSVFYIYKTNAENLLLFLLVTLTLHFVNNRILRLTENLLNMHNQ